MKTTPNTLQFLRASTKRIAGAALCAAMVAGAAPTLANDNVPSTRTITRINVFATKAFVQMTPVHTNGDNCAARTANQYAVIDWSRDPDVKTMLATVLLAKSTGAKVGFGLSGCNGNELPLAFRVDLAD